jgi:phospholipase C
MGEKTTMRRLLNLRLAVAVSAAAFAFSGCGGNPSTAGLPNAAGPSAQQQDLRETSGGKIQHVVVIIQENRSFDNLFQGYPNADTQPYGYASNGTKVTLNPITMATDWDITHDAAGFIAACDGSGSLPGTNCKMDGFDKEAVGCGGIHPPCPFADPQYAYVPKSESKPYFTIAKQYVLADRMFTSNYDSSSFVSHQYLIAGQASKSVDYPLNVWGCDGDPRDTVKTLTSQRTFGKSILPCFENQTLGDELDAAGLSWRYYTSKLGSNGTLWSAYQAIKHIREGPEWNTNVISPQTKFMTDIKNGKMPVVSWVTPTCQNSDHAGCTSNHGPQWVASLVNAVGKSSYWNSTAIFIMWDDPGGWFDHVPPPFKDFDGLGARVPLLIVSPYAKQGWVSHVSYEHGSILRFIEDQFGLARLAATDKRAKSPQKDCFDFTQQPRAFKAIPAKLSESYFEHEPLDPRPPDNE